MLEKQSKAAKITLSSLFIFIGLSLLLFNYFVGIKSNLVNEKNFELMEQIVSIEEVPEEIIEESPVVEPEVIPEETTTTVVTTEIVDKYIGFLNIDKLNLKRGFLSVDSKRNNISYNVMLVKGSTMPDVENGNIILAAHSGTAAIGYFKHLYKLELGDEASITYNNKVYSYKLVNIYTELKNGSVNIKRDRNKSALTLITCTKGDNTTQSIYIFELI